MEASNLDSFEPPGAQDWSQQQDRSNKNRSCAPGINTSARSISPHNSWKR